MWNAVGDEALSICWTLDDLGIDLSTVRDAAIFAAVDGAPIQYVGRTGGGSASFFEWRTNQGILTQAFQNGPQPGTSYRFAIFLILNERDENNRFTKFGPCFMTGAVNFAVN